MTLVSPLVLDEVAHNLHNKAPKALLFLPALLRAIPLEVVAEARDTDIAGWRDAGFGTDAPVIAAAIAAQADVFCTGDRKLLRELAGYTPPFPVIPPGVLLGQIRDAQQR